MAKGKKVPQPTQRRYRGVLRRDMRSAQKHIRALLNWNLRFVGKPIDYYPNQLAPAAEVGLLTAAAIQLSQWLQEVGPIPSR
jgi:hypothetical protein